MQQFNIYIFYFFFFNDTATTEIYTLSLHRRSSDLVGMASLAGLLQSKGYRITGSDQNIYPPMSTYLQEIGIDILAGFSPEHLSVRPDLVIIGNAVSRNNAEAEAVVNQGIPYISFPQGLGKFLIGSRQSLVITGTHGKTTTT